MDAFHTAIDGIVKWLLSISLLGIIWAWLILPAIKFIIQNTVFIPLWNHFTKKQPVKAAILEHYKRRHVAADPKVCTEYPCNIVPER